MSFYYDFPTSNITSIDVNFEDYQSGDQILNHMHYYYEFTMVTKGTCIHKFRGVEVPIIAGDVFLIPPHESHAYYMHSAASIVNCYFFPARLGQFAEYVSDGAFEREYIPTGLGDVKKQWDSLLAVPTARNGGDSRQLTDNLSKQGVLHLPPGEAMDVENLLWRIKAEHLNLQFDAEYMKAALLQMILVIFKRARSNVPQKTPERPEPKKQLIIQSLIFLDEHYQEELSIKEIAAASSLSESYFRSVFKEVTGLSPLDYLNRIRIAKALEYLQNGAVTISEAAAKVGIPDSNYFTRVFKKIMGHPPRYFKNNPNAPILKED